MPVTDARPVGGQGLNLAVDPTVANVMALADGARFPVAGRVQSRFGRVAAGLSWPEQPVDNIAHFHTPASARCRGFAPYYDQRFETRQSSGVIDYAPQRLNFVTKSQGRLYLNNDPDTYLAGDPFFVDASTRCKIISYGDKLYIIDQGSKPKVLQRLPKEDQAYGQRVKYDIRNMGVNWPLTTTPRPTITTTPDVSGNRFSLPEYIYRARITLVNKFGIESNPSLSKTIHEFGRLDRLLRVGWSNADFPAGTNAVSKVRVYISYELVKSNAVEPSAFFFAIEVASSVTTVDLGGFSVIQGPIGPLDSSAQNTYLIPGFGAPPKLRDATIINGVLYGICDIDEVARESDIGQGEARQLHLPRVPNSQLRENTVMRGRRFDPSYMVIGRPGEPEHQFAWEQFCQGSEVGIGICALGQNPVIFTNQGIKVWDVESEAIRDTPAEIGAISRDSIRKTERGIRFVGTDRIPRLFNGATVEEVADELSPIFDDAAYVGDYLQFDRDNPQEICCAAGNRRFYMTYPVAPAGSISNPTKTMDSAGMRNLAVADESRGRAEWAVDRYGYESVHWLGRENRMLAFDMNGYAYFIEESMTDAVPGGTQLIAVDWKFRKFWGSNGMEGQFFRFAIDIDTGGSAVNVVFQVDDNPGLTFTYAIQTSGRRELKHGLPPHFWGRYITIEFAGVLDPSRLLVYNQRVATTQAEEF